MLKPHYSGLVANDSVERTHTNSKTGHFCHFIKSEGSSSFFKFNVKLICYQLLSRLIISIRVGCINRILKRGHFYGHFAIFQALKNRL